MAQSLSAQACEDCLRLVIDQAQGFGLDLELIPSRIADSPQHASRVVGERPVMQDAYLALFQVCLPAQGIDQLAVGCPIQAQGHGIDAEVTPAQVIADGGALYGRESTGLGIRLRTSRDQIQEGREFRRTRQGYIDPPEGRLVRRPGGSAKAPVEDHPAGIFTQ